MSDLSDQSELAEFDFDGTAIQNAGDDGWTQTRGDYQFGFRGDVRQSIRGETKFTLQATTFVVAPTAAIAANQVPLYSTTISARTDEQDEQGDAGSGLSTAQFPTNVYSGDQTISNSDDTAADLGNYFNADDFAPQLVQLDLVSINGETLNVRLTGLDSLPTFDSGELHLRFVDDEGNEVEAVISPQPKETAKPDPEAEPTAAITQAKSPDSEDDFTSISMMPEADVTGSDLMGTPKSISEVETRQETTFATERDEVTEQKPDDEMMMMPELEPILEPVIEPTPEKSLTTPPPKDKQADKIAEPEPEISMPSVNFIFGDDGRNKHLNGTAENDAIFGYAGDDRLYGGDHHDVLNGMAGLDLLVGGAGSDKFVIDFANLEEADIVTDFGYGKDKIRMNVDDDILAAVKGASGNDAKLELLRNELGLDWSSDNYVDTSTKSNDAEKADTVITLNGDDVLVLEDYTDDLDFTQFDIF